MPPWLSALKGLHADYAGWFFAAVALAHAAKLYWCGDTTNAMQSFVAAMGLVGVSHAVAAKSADPQPPAEGEK